MVDIGCMTYLLYCDDWIWICIILWITHIVQAQDVNAYSHKKCICWKLHIVQEAICFAKWPPWLWLPGHMKLRHFPGRRILRWLATLKICKIVIECVFAENCRLVRRQFALQTGLPDWDCLGIRCFHEEQFSGGWLPYKVLKKSSQILRVVFESINVSV